MRSSEMMLNQQPTVQRTQAERSTESPWPFRFVLLSLIFEFARPQEIIPGIRAVPIPTLLNLLIGLSLLTSQRMNFRNTQTKLWLVLMGFMALHVPIATNNFWALMILKDMGLWLCFYLGLITYVNTFAKLRTLVSVWLGLHVITSSIGIAHGGTGVGGWMGDENDFCMAINMVVPFAYFMIFSAPSAIKKNLYIGLLGLFVLTIMTTLSRGGFMGLAASGVYCWLKSSRKMGAILIMLLVCLFMMAVMPDKYWDEITSSFSDQELESGTASDRFYMWGIGFEMFLGNPILGVGQGNFPWNFEEYEAGRIHDGKSRAGRMAHSLYMTLLPEMGIVGVLIFGAMLFFNYRDARLVELKMKTQVNVRDERVMDETDSLFLVNLVRAIEASLAGFLVTSVFISDLWYPSFWVMMGFMVALRNTVVGLVDRQLVYALNGEGMVDRARSPNQVAISGGLRASKNV